MVSKDNVEGYRCPRWAELPSIPLYMDQVVMVIGDALSIFGAADEPVITSTMINNYVKQKIISPPENKKYCRNQIGRLIVLTLFKRVFSIAEITIVIADMEDVYGVGEAYDIFCDALEAHLGNAFTTQTYDINVANEKEPERSMMETALGAVMCKLLVQSKLEGRQPKEKPAAK